MDLKIYIHRCLQELSSLGSFSIFIVAVVLTIVLQWYRIAATLVLFFIISYAIITLLRLSKFNDRPTKRKYTNWLEKVDAGSFPSSHAIRVGFWVVLIWNYINNPLKILILIVAILILYSRITLKEHHIKDVVLGVIIGIILGMIAVQFI